MTQLEWIPTKEAERMVGWTSNTLRKKLILRGAPFSQFIGLRGKDRLGFPLICCLLLEQEQRLETARKRLQTATVHALQTTSLTHAAIGRAVGLTVFQVGKRATVRRNTRSVYKGPRCKYCQALLTGFPGGWGGLCGWCIEELLDLPEDTALTTRIRKILDTHYQDPIEGKAIREAYTQKV